MGFTDAIKSCLTQFADAKGRAGRSEYWYFYLLYVIIYNVANILEGRTHTLTDLVSVVFAIPILTASIRRMHDVGKSGWFLIIPFYDLYLAVQPSQPGSNQWGVTKTV